MPDTFNMCLDYPQKLSVTMVCTLSNEHQTDPVIRGDEGSIVLQTDWSSGVDNYTLIPRQGEKHASSRAAAQIRPVRTGRTSPIAFAPGRNRSATSASGSRCKPR